MAVDTTTNFWYVNKGLAVTVKGGSPIYYIGDSSTLKISVTSIGKPFLFPSSQYKESYLKANEGQPQLKPSTNYSFIVTINNDQYKVKWQDVTLGDPFNQDKKDKINTPDEIKPIAGNIEEKASRPELVYNELVSYLLGQ
jgi:hypothetical protein